MEKIKLQSIQVTLSDGQVLNVHEMTGAQFEQFLSALGSLEAIQAALSAFQMRKDGVIGLPTYIPKGTTKELIEVVASMADISVEEYNTLPFGDYLAIFNAAALMMGKIKNVSSPRTRKSRAGAASTSSVPSSGDITEKS